MKVILQYIFILAVFFNIASQNAFAKEAGIAVVVNGEAILNSDIEYRVDWAIHTTRTSDTPAVRQKIRDKIIDLMINEALMRQTAAQFKIEVSDSEIKEMLESIAAQAGLDAAQFDAELAAQHIPKEVFYNQAKAQLLWRHYMIERYQGNVQISDQEIAEYKKAAAQESKEDRYHLEEIVIISDDIQKARDFCDQIKAGAHFGTLAQQVSQAPSAVNGGDLGFLRATQMPPEIFEAVKNLNVGQVSEPIRVGQTYHIVCLKDKKAAGQKDEQVVLTFMQAVLPLPKNGTQADLDKLMDEAIRLSRGITSASIFKKMAEKHPDFRVRTVENMPIQSVHPDLLSVLLGQPQGVVSQPLQTPEGIFFFALEKREVQKEAELTDSMIRSRIANERMNQLAAMNIKKIRQHAYIEQRI